MAKGTLKIAYKIKVLGIYLTGTLNWDDQAEEALQKGKML